MKQFKPSAKFSELMDVTVPKGQLFYPCCGHDTMYPLWLFKGMIHTFHFADPNRIALPNVENLSDFNERPDQITTQDTLDKQLYIVRQKSTPSYYIERWEQRDSKKRMDVFSHLSDGANVLENLKSISIFFYRGDSIGEGGSGIMWFGPELFNKVLDKLVDGGLIITDGSNPDKKHLLTKWKSLYEHSHWDFPDLKEGEKPANFTYDWKKFTCIGKIGERYGDVYVWQVHNISKY